MLRWFVPAFVAFMLYAAPARALSDVPGSRDHPLFRRPPGYKIVSYSRGNGSTAIPFPGGASALSGKQVDILYKTEGRPLSPSDLDERFTAALKKAGAEIVSKENPLLGGRRIVGRLTRPGRYVWVIQDVLSLREYRLVTVETPNNLLPLPALSVSKDIYETEAQVLDLLHLVERTGKLEFPVKFAPGTVVPLKGYEANFRKTAMLMEKDPSLVFRVETWADANARPVEARVQLRDRTAALVNELVRMGADADRLTDGSGDEKGATVPSGVVRLTAVDPTETAVQ